MVKAEKGVCPWVRGGICGESLPVIVLRNVLYVHFVIVLDDWFEERKGGNQKMSRRSFFVPTD